MPVTVRPPVPMAFVTVLASPIPPKGNEVTTTWTLVIVLAVEETVVVKLVLVVNVVNPAGESGASDG